ncbi:MAG: c-type cytochrome [Chloroflexi bacterium]|nr:c-type cytochrome [Chloroflexota bacterium]MBL7164222.1 c-type cytochrome [Anaerolineales bacterium]
MNAKRSLLFTGILLAIILIGFVLYRQQFHSSGAPVTISGITVPPLPRFDPAQIELGSHVYAQNCASCHGAILEGQPNWKQTRSDGKLPAPPQDSSGHTWHHADDVLISIIANGGDPSYSNMPAFREILTEAEIIAVLDFIKSSWGQDEREYQWWLSMRDQY